MNKSRQLCLPTTDSRSRMIYKPKQTTVLIQIISNFEQFNFSLASVGWPCAFRFWALKNTVKAFCSFPKTQWTKLSRTCVWETNLKCRRRAAAFRAKTIKLVVRVKGKSDEEEFLNTHESSSPVGVPVPESQNWCPQS